MESLQEVVQTAETALQSSGIREERWRGRKGEREGGNVAGGSVL